MPNDSTPTPQPNDKTDPKKPRKSPGPVDQKKLNQLIDDQEVIEAIIDEVTNDSALGTELAKHFIDKDKAVPATLINLQALDKQATKARQAAAAQSAGKATAHDVTEDESAEAKTARAAIRAAQSVAKESHEESNPKMLEAYYVAQPLRSRSQITAAGTAIYQMLRTTDDDGNPVTPKDTLPGYDDTGLANFLTALGDYIDIQTAQSKAQKDATDAGTDFSTQAEQIMRRRRRLQFALDAMRPFGQANTAFRRRIGLPTDKGMS